MGAIAAAIAAYLEEEKAPPEAIAPEKPPFIEARPVARIRPPFSAWAAFGRQEMARMRTLWQLRIVPRAKRR